MNPLDNEILKLLKLNARESFSNIGKAVGISAPAVGKRVRQLEEDGIIEGYALRLNDEKLGIETKAYISLVIHEGPTGTPRAQEKLRAMEEVQRCDRVTGDDCLCLLAYFNNNKHLVTFLETIAEYGTSKTRIILEA